MKSAACQQSGDRENSQKISSPDIGRDADSLLAIYRKQIDEVDARLITVLGQRFELTQSVGQLKSEADLPPSDPQREARQVRQLRVLGEKAGVDPELIERLFNLIFQEVVTHHKRLKR